MTEPVLSEWYIECADEKEETELTASRCNEPLVPSCPLNTSKSLHTRLSIRHPCIIPVCKKTPVKSIVGGSWDVVMSGMDAGKESESLTRWDCSRASTVCEAVSPERPHRGRRGRLRGPGDHRRGHLDYTTIVATRPHSRTRSARLPSFC